MTRMEFEPTLPQPEISQWAKLLSSSSQNASIFRFKKKTLHVQKESLKRASSCQMFSDAFLKNRSLRFAEIKNEQRAYNRYMEMPGIEPGASHMQSVRSTTELHPRWRPCGWNCWLIIVQIMLFQIMANAPFHLARRDISAKSKRSRI